MEKTEQLIFNLAPYPMWIYDAKTLKFLAVNHEAVRVYGYTEKEFLSMTIEQIRPAEDIPLLHEAISKINKREGTFKQSLFRHSKKNGEIMYVRIKGNLIEFNGSEAEIVTSIDLTEVHEKEQRIERQKKYLELIGKINRIFLEEDNWRNALQRSFQEMITVLEFNRIWHTQKEGSSKKNTVEVFANNCDTCVLSKNHNHELCAVLHGSQETLELLESKEIINYNISNLPDSDLKKGLVEEGIQSILLYPVETNKEYAGCIALVDHDIERNWIDQDYQLLSVLSTNLTKAFEKEKIREKLFKSEKKFRSLVQNGSELITIMDENGQFSYASPTSLKILDLPKDKFHNNNLFDFVHPEDIPLVENAIQQSLQGKRVTVPYFRVLLDHNKTKYLRSVLTNLLNDPAVNGIVANSTDVTQEVEKQKVAELLLKLSKAIGQPGTVTHTLKIGIAGLMKFSKTEMGEFWIKSADGSRLDLVVNDYSDPAGKIFKDASTHITSFPMGIGLPGTVGKTRKSVIWKDLPNNQNFIRHNAAGLSGFVKAIGAPVFFNDEFIGVFLLFSKDENHPLETEQKIYEDIGKSIGSVLKQKLLEEEYSSFFNMSPTIQCILNPHGDILKSNVTCTKLLNIEEEIVNNNIYRFVDERDHALFKNALNKYHNLTEKITFETKIKTKDATPKWILWSIVFQPHKKLFYAVGQDITLQKYTDEQLLYTNTLLTQAQELAKLGYWRNNMQTRTIEWSAETYKIFELNPHEFTPTLPAIQNMFHPEDRYWVSSNPADIFTPGEPQSFEYRIISGSGKIKWLKQEMKFSTDEKGKPLLLEGTIQDITQAKKQLDYIEQQNKKLREIAWMQSHVLRAPLVRMMGAIDVIREIPATTPETKQMMDAVLFSAHEMDEIIHDINEQTKILKDL